jgi:protoporphyrinogen oxidase
MILILGGGLAGMSTAMHLGDREHLVLEASTQPGGLCRTRDVNGFLFDYTGHLLHLRDERIISLVDEMLPDAFDTIERKARIRTHGVTLPFPFQANLHGLPQKIVSDCLVGFAESQAIPIPEAPETSFEEWSLAVFGRGISDTFMLPYNCKLFCREPEQMTADWVSWAVPKPTPREVVDGALGVRNEGMGYNSSFRYPRKGGIGTVPEAVAERVEHMRLGQRVTSVDLDRREVGTESGETHGYDELVMTLPLPAFLKMARGGPAGLSDYADALDWSVVACWNLGIDRPGVADGAHWIYYPDSDTPFYRAGFPSNFSDSVAPAGTSSLYVEFGLKRGQRPDKERLEREARAALEREGILTPDDKVLASDWIVIDPGYVIFDRERQRVMRDLVPELERYGVHLIGRYGAWTYSYMERALLDGLEVAERVGQGMGHGL